MLAYSKKIDSLWIIEKLAAGEVVPIEKEIYLTHKAKEREYQIRYCLN
jgi:hypothetical protein